jgi:hypothetical protein
VALLALLLQISQNTARSLSTLIFRVSRSKLGESEKHHQNRKNKIKYKLPKIFCRNYFQRTIISYYYMLFLV